MMNYEMFKAMVKEKFLDFLPEQFQNAEIEVRPVNKVNQTQDSLTIKNLEEGLSISPSIYIDDLYQMYLDTEDIGITLTRAAEIFAQGMEFKEEISVSDMLDASTAKDRIIFQLINTEQNKEMLADMPHREFEDLSVIYRLVARIDGSGMISSPVHNNLAKNLGFSEEQMFQMAVENTKRLLPPVVTSLDDVMREMYEKDGLPPEAVDTMLAQTVPEQKMYVITNTMRTNGACGMLYEELLHNIAEEVGSDLYIIPSSIHEIITVGSEMHDPNSLAEEVVTVNQEQVSVAERLSNQVYHYDKNLRKVSLATDTPNKRLDGIVAEAPMVYEAGRSR
jgi:hypothetical protein